MGTHSITRVILDGEIKVNQFGQLNGYPTDRGCELLMFTRNLIQTGQVDSMKSVLRNSSLVVYDGETDREESSADPQEDVLVKVVDQMEAADKPFPDAVSNMLREGELTLDQACYAMAVGRDVGNKILPFMIEHKPAHIELYTDSDLINMPPEGDMDTESVFVLDFDAENIEIWWHGIQQAYSFEALANCSEDQIIDDMDTLEGEPFVDEDEEDIEDILSTIM